MTSSKINTYRDLHARLKEVHELTEQLQIDLVDRDHWDSEIIYCLDRMCIGLAEAKTLTTCTCLDVDLNVHDRFKSDKYTKFKQNQQKYLENIKYKDPGESTFFD